MFFDPRKYDFSKVGRLKFNIKLDLSTDLNLRILTKERTKDNPRTFSQ
jgi:DNA-directed RNA polymerase subunit beta